MKLILVMAVTADGKIAHHEGHFPDWTGKADKRMFKRLTEESGVVIMGSHTFAAIGKPLPNRLNVVLTRRPERYRAEQNVVFSADPPDVLLTSLASRGYRSAILAGGATINSVFLRERLIDEILLTIAPKIFGQGLSLFSETANVDLELISSEILEPGFLVLHYRLVYGR